MKKSGDLKLWLWNMKHESGPLRLAWVQYQSQALVEERKKDEWVMALE